MRPLVHIVDDDPDVRLALSLVLEHAEIDVAEYGTAEELLSATDRLVVSPACILADVRLPGLSGLGLQVRLNEAGIRTPVIVMSGAGDVPVVVQAIRSGAIDFLQKPVTWQTLVERVRYALDCDARQSASALHHREAVDRMKSLSVREREVMTLLSEGESLKAIACQLGVTHQTVARHRAAVFQKLQVGSLAEMIHMVVELRSSKARTPERCL